MTLKSVTLLPVAAARQSAANRDASGESAAVCRRAATPSFTAFGCLFALCFLLASLTASAQQTPPPQFTPADGSAIPTNVVISCQDVHVLVYFTTDGTEATSNATLYTTPVYVTNTTTFRTRAYLAGFAPSDERTATFYERHHLADLQKLVANNGTPVPSIQISVTPDASVGCYAVEDSIPLPLVVQNVTGGGIWDGTNRIIRWGPFRDNQSRAFSYQVTHASDGDYEIWSQVSLNGFSTTPADINTKATVTVFHFTGTVDTPVFTPGPTNPPVTVSLTCTTALAQVYFTTNGRVPTTNDTLYTTSLALTDTTFLRARGFREGWQPSEVASAVYWATNPPPPVRSITNATGASALVNLQVPVPPGAICFALVERLPIFLEPTQISDGGLWQEVTRTIVWGPFRQALPTNLWYSVGGLDGNYLLDGTASFDGSLVAVAGTNALAISNPPMLQLATPSIVPPGNTNVPVTVTFSSTNVGAAIYYTTNGALPTVSDLLYTAPLALTNDTFLRVRAFQAGWYPSEVANAMYWETLPRPLLTRSLTNDVTPLPEVRVSAAPLAGTLSYAVEERLPLLVTPSGISDGGSWDVTTSTLRWGPFRDGLARTLRYRLGGVPGTHALDGTGSFDGRSYAVTGAVQVVIVSYLDQQVATPVLSPTGSTSLPVVVTISCVTAGAEIHYTTDTRVPGLGDPLYTGSMTLTVPTVLRARAFVAGMTASDTVTGHYATNEPPLGSIVRSVTGNSGLFPMCNLAVLPSAAVTTYAVEEVLPGTVWPTNITHGGRWDAATLSIRWGPFRDNLTRTLSYFVNAADGSFTPDATASFNGWSTKAAGEAIIIVSGHDQQVATPTITPASGTPLPVLVTLSNATPGAVIHYTTNGQVPTMNDAIYAGPLGFTAETALRARAFVTGMLPSDTASAWYPATNAQPAPVRSISGSPSSVQSVSISVVPLPAVREYAVEEYVPWPLAPSGINFSGRWSADDRLIRWGPFGDNVARMFGYAVSGPDGSYTLSGAASFDGRQRETVGATTLQIQLPAPSPLVGLAGKAAAYLNWPRQAGVAGYYVYVWPDGGLYSQTRLDAGIPATDYFSVTNLINNTKYYFSVTAYDATRHESGRSENVWLVPSATNGTLGFVSFDRPYYSVSNQAVLTVVDPDLNTDTQTVQTVSVRITSDSDAWGFNMTLTEAGTNTDVFTSAATGTNLCFTTGDSDTNRFCIKVNAGGRVWVTYQDLQPMLGRTSSALVDSDIDHDGLPDWWEWQFVGNLTNLSAMGDWDGDGLTDAQEHQLGTNPIDPYTRGYLFAPVRQAGGSFQCDFVGETNRQYRVLVSTNAASWSVLTNVVGWRDRFADPSATNYSPQRFYRTVLLP